MRILTRVVRRLVVAAALVAAPVASFAGIFISVGIAPPALPVYTQPLCPGDGYLWTPGYWAWGPAGYYWVPGVWVRPPQVGFLWTPGYWGWGGGHYLFHEGYWGSHIGFYGGVNYGFGYGGVGYEGGYWNHDVFAYNRSVNNINVTSVHNVYNKTIIVNNVNRVSYNGGNGGVQARASEREQAAIRENHVAATGEQQTHFQAARADRSQLASVNGGRPQMAAARTPNDYRTVAQQRAVREPISAQDRAAAQRPAGGAGVRPMSSQEARPQVQAQNRPQVQQQARPAPDRPAPDQARPQAQQARPQTRPQGESHPQGHEGGERPRR